MPTVNGKKMACAPCIRGHRSTNCNHDKEGRVLIEVRKPGRPLSNCPCRPGKPCACGVKVANIKVAIPKKKTCGGCPPSGQKQKASHSPELSPSHSIPSPTANLYRVSKTDSALRHGRKPSWDSAKLARLDHFVGNMISPGNTGPGAGTMATSMAMVMNGVPPAQSFNLAANYGVGIAISNLPFSPGFSPGQGSFLPPNMPIPYNGHPPQQSIKMEDGLSSPYPVASNLDRGLPMHSQPQQYSLSPPYALTQQYSHDTTHRRTSSLSTPDYLATLPGLDTSSVTHSLASAHPAAWMSMPHCPPSAGPGMSMSHYSPTHYAPTAGPAPGSKPAIQHYEPQAETKHQIAPVPMDMSTVFTYPANYGSWDMPMNPQMWEQVSQQGMAAPPMSAAPNNGMPDLGTSHQCTCGPGCQCIGCVAHPFNDRTYEYVNSAYVESNGTNGHSNPSSPFINGTSGVSVTNGANSNGVHVGNSINGTAPSNDTKPGSCCAPAATTTQTPDMSPKNDTKPGSCCAPAATTTTQTPDMSPKQQAPESPSAPPSNETKPGSCCAPAPATTSPKQVHAALPDAHTPSSDGAEEEQPPLDDLDFLWINMPLAEAGGCFGFMDSCLCGDNCKCVGCKLHNT